MEGVDQVVYLTSTDQEIPDWLVNLTFLEEVETAISLGIKSWYADVEFSTSDAISGTLFLFNKANFRIPFCNTVSDLNMHSSY